MLDYGWQFRLNGDTAWVAVDLPHDWSIECDFDSLAPAGNDGGYLPTGKGEYRRNLHIDSKDDTKLYGLIIEGAYMDSKVYVNGQEAGGWPYGYTTYTVDITPYVNTGDNQLTITVDNSKQKNSRWYSGSGLYRHVWLTVTDKTSVPYGGIVVTTPIVSVDSASVCVNVAVVNQKDESKNITATLKITCDGKPVASQRGPVKWTSDSTGTADAVFEIKNPKLWSPEQPNMYQLTVILKDNGEVIDVTTQKFGIREFAYSADKGLTLNGKELILNGGCVHHDNGILGAASYDAAEARKVALMKQAGFNAVRTSHNPPAPAFLDACDSLGLIVIDEIFDGWRQAKNPHDYAVLFDEWALKDVSAMVVRDRNHPSIMAWSIGNEILERKTPEAVATAHMLASQCRELDPTRPVTQALASWDPDWEIYDSLAAQTDIVGYNYMIHKHSGDHKRVPDRVIWQTESYPRDAFSNWCIANDNKYVIGDFVWTAIDYMGESGIGRHYYEGQVPGEHYHRPLWPWHGALCGDIDLTGMRKPVSYYRDMLYNPAMPALHMSVREPEGYVGEIRETLWGHYPTYDSWNWAGHEGKPIVVEVATNSDMVKLYLNDKLIDEKPASRATEYMALFTIPYEPGELKAVTSDGLSSVLRTAGAPAKIMLTVDRDTIQADNQDLAYVVAQLVDADGTPVPDCDMNIEFDVQGAGTLLAAGSADVTDSTGYRSGYARTSNGRAVAIVKSGHKPGNITLSASAHNLTKSTTHITSL